MVGLKSLVMDGDQAMGYVMLSCKRMGLPPDMVKQLHSRMLIQFDENTPKEAEIKGQEWLRSLEKDKADNQMDNPLELSKTRQSALPRRSLNLKLPEIGESHHMRQLRQDNEVLKRRLQQLQGSPFGLFNVLRRIKR